jgi:ParB-like chromosome segregation protein Spo0J
VTGSDGAALDVVLVPLDELRPDPGNARTHSDRNVAVIAASLRRFGQRKPIVIAPDRHVIAGSGTLEAARRLGWTQLACTTFDDDDDEAKAYAIADNRSAELAAWDGELLTARLSELSLLDEGLVGTGFTDADVLRLHAQPDTSEQLGGVAFMVLVEVDDEREQADVLDRLIGEGLRARPIMG